jgi:hypothetical protein
MFLLPERAHRRVRAPAPAAATKKTTTKKKGDAKFTAVKSKAALAAGKRSTTKKDEEPKPGPGPGGGMVRDGRARRKHAGFSLTCSDRSAARCKQIGSMGVIGASECVAHVGGEGEGLPRPSGPLQAIRGVVGDSDGLELEQKNPLRPPALAYHTSCRQRRARIPIRQRRRPRSMFRGILY